MINVASCLFYFKATGEDDIKREDRLRVTVDDKKALVARVGVFEYYFFLLYARSKDTLFKSQN
jgi:hypothetical protein